MIRINPFNTWRTFALIQAWLMAGFITVKSVAAVYFLSLPGILRWCARARLPRARAAGDFGYRWITGVDHSVHYYCEHQALIRDSVGAADAAEMRRGASLDVDGEVLLEGCVGSYK